MIVLASVLGANAVYGEPLVHAPRLYRDSDEQLAVARANGDAAVMMIFAAVSGHNADLVASIEAAGGTIRYRNDDVDYVRARVPIADAIALAENRSVESAQVARDTVDDLLYATHDARFEAPRPRSASGEAALHHPYWPGTAVGADAFLRESPTFDGRGVGIAYVEDQLPDFLLPGYGSATTLDGRPTDKVIDIFRSADPRDEPTDATWVPVHDVVSSATNLVSYHGLWYRLPHAGTFHIGIFQEPAVGDVNGSSFQSDLERNGRPPGDDGRFAVLWDPIAQRVWVDVDRDRDFTTHPSLADYRVHHDVGLFGHDHPGAPLRGTVGFAVQIDAPDQEVSINLGVGVHATFVAGQAAANGGRFRGIAPGATYGLYAAGSGSSTSSGAKIEALLAAMNNPGIDVITYEDNGFIDDHYLIRDGHMVPSVILDRAVTFYKKTVVVTGANAPGLGNVDEEATASGVIGISGYQSAESYRRNFDIIVARHDNLHALGLSPGPSGDGALKPDVLAPAGDVGGSLGFANAFYISNIVSFPAGYDIGGGTSEATPNAAGAIALLVSAAKQRNVPYDPERIAYAIRNGARRFAPYSAYQQANGLIDIPAAWRILQQIAHRPLIEITATAPVSTVESRFLPVANRGRGLYEREGWSAGSMGIRTIRLVRTSGSIEPMRFAVRWIGDQTSFSGVRSVLLPLNVPVDYAVRIHTATVGAHSVILALSTPAQPGDALRVLTTVVAAPSVAAGRVIKARLNVESPLPTGTFVRVEPGTAHLDIVMKAKDRTHQLYVITPMGHFDIPRGSKWLVPGGSPARSTFDDPMPGVWEIGINDALGIVYGGNAAERHAHGSVPVTLEISSRAATGALPSPSDSVAGGAQKAIEITVPTGVSKLDVRMQPLGGGENPLDLYLLQCTKARCISVAFSTGGNVANVRTLEAIAPAPGRWIAVVDAFGIAPSASVPFRLDTAMVR